MGEQVLEIEQKAYDARREAQFRKHRCQAGLPQKQMWWCKIIACSRMDGQCCTRCSVLTGEKNDNTLLKALPGLEPGFWEHSSESQVITTTL